MINRYVFIIVVLIIIGCNRNANIEPLPVFGQKEFIEGIDLDTIYHTVPNWSFQNQYGYTVKSDFYSGKIYVVDFFFSHCPTICPAMTMNMVKLQKMTKELNVAFVSFTVDPKNDTSERLLWYQNAFGINGANWNLLTGDQTLIYKLGVNGFLVPNQQDALAPGGFLHSQKMMLIDAEGRIRGYYDGTDIDQMSIILNDIVKLKQE